MGEKNTGNKVIDLLSNWFFNTAFKFFEGGHTTGFIIICLIVLAIMVVVKTPRNEMVPLMRLLISAIGGKTFLVGTLLALGFYAFKIMQDVIAFNQEEIKRLGKEKSSLMHEDEKILKHNSSNFNFPDARARADMRDK